MFLVTRFFEGGDLERFMSNRGLEKLDEERLHEIAFKIAEGLSYLHKKNIVHRDIKPENILLKDKTENSDVVLCDFGFSQRLKKEKKCTQICGSKGFMAPEVLDGQPYSFPADVWSFGVMLYALVSGKLPFGVPDLPL